MWSYYGSKSKNIKEYPSPKYNLIIEPFAGTARFSLLYYKNRKIILNDKYKVITDIWTYLKQASPEQIKNLPELEKGDDLRNFDMLPVERDLMGFMVNRGVPKPKNIYTNWAASSNEIIRVKQRILDNLDKIRHFVIVNGDYRDLKNVEATWFIDPPYQEGGVHYVHNKIDYHELGDWCKYRKGQVIVCENSSASWLNFKPLVELWGQRKKTKEVIWTKGDKIRSIKPYLHNNTVLYQQTNLF